MTGYMSNWMMVNDPTFNAFYPAALAATSIPDVKKVLTAANLYSLQQHYYISYFNPTPWVLLHRGSRVTMAKTGQSGDTGTVPRRFFTGARFWIDPSVKKSLGY